MEKSKLGFYLWAYDNVGSVDYIFAKLRESYPTSSVVLSSDNGQDFTEISKRHGCSKYIHGKESHGPCDQTKKSGRYGWTREQAKLWLDRVYEACLSIDNDYVMLMEEDVLVKRRFSFPAQDIIMIPGFKNPISRAGMDWIRRRGGKVDYPYYSAGGGSIIKKASFISSYENHTQRNNN